MSDTDQFSEVEILALTAIGESEELGETGMTQTINSVMNRVAANKPWMGGSNARDVCLQKGQYDCWDAGMDDRQRILSIGARNQTYGPYLVALRLAQSALAGNLADTTNHAVSYVDGNAKACVHRGSLPCFIYGERKGYDLKAVA